MAHFAQLDENNVVTQVIVVNNKDTSTEDGLENENIGIAFCRSLFGENTNWKQTSYNANFRKNYAGIGFEYNPNLDAFVAPKPYPSWLLDEETCKWYPPVPYPTDDKRYSWNEDRLTWDEVV
jgi:hypothetical protein